MRSASRDPAYRSAPRVSLRPSRTPAAWSALLVAAAALVVVLVSGATVACLGADLRTVLDGSVFVAVVAATIGFGLAQGEPDGRSARLANGAVLAVVAALVFAVLAWFGSLALLAHFGP